MITILDHVGAVPQSYVRSLATLQMPDTDQLTLMQQKHDEFRANVRPEV
jgi:hypothetical protein